MSRDKLLIVGCGLMGPGIAASAALAGRTVVLCDCAPHRACDGIERAHAHIRQLCDGGLATPESAERAAGLLASVDSIDDEIGNASLVIEAITENLAAKQELFAELDRKAPLDVTIASNTSGLRITEIAARMEHPERAVTAHFWFPAHLVPLVEVVVGERTELAVAEALRDELVRWGKAAVLVRQDLPGQLANRMLQAVIREATNIVEMGLATPEDVDTAIKMGMGIRLPAWGPLEHIDAVGLDLALSVQRGVLPGLRNDPTPSPALERRVAEGALGAKTGHGFYDWTVKDMAALAARRDDFIMAALRILSGSSS